MDIIDASSTGGTEPDTRHCFALYAGEADQEQLNFDSTLVLDLVSDLLKLPAFCRRFYEQKDWRLEETLICATGTMVSEEVLQQSPDDFLAGALSACVLVL